IFLHECGHCETDASRKRGQDFYINHGDGSTALHNTAGEAAAWEWAKEHALVWTDVMQAELRYGLTFYKSWASKGAEDPTREQLDPTAGRRTLGNALLQQQRREMADRIALVKEWQRPRPLSEVERLEQLVNRWSRP